MGRRGAAAALIAFCLAAPPLFRAQDPTFRVDVNLVRILATVKNAEGQPVGGLKASDLSVFDNGAPQEIALFERHTAQPLSIAVLLDISGSTAREMKNQNEAVSRFATALFSEGNAGDRASLFTFNWQVSQEVGWTRKPASLTAGLKNLKAEAGTALYDALLLAAQAVEERDGRHVIVVVTDGGDTVSNTNFHQALEAAHRADAVVYPILTVPIRGDAGRNVGGENALTNLARTTGGKMFRVGSGGLDEAFEGILRDLRTQYLIGYYPRGVPATKDRFHRIDIKPVNPDLRVVARTGYYGEAADTSGPRNK